METEPIHHVTRETLLELGRASGSDDLAHQAKTSGDVRILLTSGKARLLRDLDAVARTLVWLGVENAQLKLGPCQPRSTARP